MSPKGALESPAIRNADLPRERGKSEEKIRKLQEMQIGTGEHPSTFEASQERRHLTCLLLGL